MPQFIPILVFLNYVLFSPSPRKNQQQEKPHFCYKFPPDIFPASMAVPSSPLFTVDGAVLDQRGRLKSVAYETWLYIGLGGVAHRPPPFCQKNQWWFVWPVFVFFWGDGFLRTFWRCQNWQAFDYEGIHMVKKDSDHQDVLDVFFFRWNWPQFKTGVFKVNRQKSAETWDASKQLWIGCPKKHGDLILSGSSQRYFLIFTLGNWSNLTNIFRNGLSWHHLVAIFMVISSWNGSIDWIWSGGASDIFL